MSLVAGGEGVVLGGTTTKDFEDVFTSPQVVIPTGTGALGGVIVSLGGFAPSDTGHIGPQVTGDGNGTGSNGIEFLGSGVRLPGAALSPLWISMVCLTFGAVLVLV